uniref:hypothetical protein n=1 Tax=Ulvibacterium marinum TaxID=2419782 RepID=UPI002494C102
DGSITSPNSTITLTGTPANSLLENVGLDVDVTALSGDGSITSPNGTVTLTGTPANSLLENVGLEVNISADADNDLGIGTDNGLFLNETDDQVASEVNSDTPIDVDGDGNTEATVEDVIQDIAPITAKAARIFYPPSIAIDASTLTNNATIDLYQEYINQFGTPTMASAGAPAAVPTYTNTELYYYVTYADPAVLNIDSISATGVMQYDVVGTPPDYNSLINVVFVVR